MILFSRDSEWSDYVHLYIAYKGEDETYTVEHYSDWWDTWRISKLFTKKFSSKDELLDKVRSLTGKITIFHDDDL